MALKNSDFRSHLGVLKSEIVGFSAGGIKFMLKSLETRFDARDLTLLVRDNLGLSLVLTDSYELFR